MTASRDRKFGLPPQPNDPYAEVCGICESVKTVQGGWLRCSHCDFSVCKSPCGICQAGSKGLPKPEATT